MKITIPLLAACLLCGCAHFGTTQTETVYSDGKASKVTTTHVGSTTFFDSSSDLSKLRVSQSDKTQTTQVGSLANESSGTNAVNLAERLGNALLTRP